MLQWFDCQWISNLQSISDAQAEPVAYVGVTVKKETADESNDTTDTTSSRRRLDGRLKLAIMPQSQRNCQTWQLAMRHLNKYSKLILNKNIVS